MRIPMDEYQQELTQIAFLLTGLEASEVWLTFLSYGGNRGRWAVAAYLNGLKPLPAHDCNLLALVINERLTELHLPHLTSDSG